MNEWDFQPAPTHNLYYSGNHKFIDHDSRTEMLEAAISTLQIHRTRSMNLSEVAIILRYKHYLN